MKEIPDGEEGVLDSNSVYNFESLEAILYFNHNGATDVNSTILMKLTNESSERTIKLYDCNGQNELTYSFPLTSGISLLHEQYQSSFICIGIIMLIIDRY